MRFGPHARWLSLPARARLALFAALLTVFAVLGSAVPLLLESDYRARALHEEAVRATLAGASLSLSGPEQLQALAQRSPLSAALLRQGGEVVGRAGEMVDEHRLLLTCAPGHAGSVRVVHLEGGIGACVALDAGGVLFATAPETDLGRARQRRQVLVLTFVFACLAGGLLSGAMQRLLAPVTRMTEQARRLASGGEVSSLGPIDPDLQPLAAALDQLGAALAAQEDDIQQRLALTQQLAAIVAHEVRNPLQSLTMLADVVAHSDDPTERKELLRSIQQELSLIEVVVQRLVSSGDALRLVRRPTRLWALIGRCIRLQAPEAREAGVRLEAELVEAAEGQLDGPLLRRAIENLIRNATSVLATKGGGQVQVRLEREGACALVHVDDDGPGVPEDRREDIFRAGVSGRPGGTGLGLHLARRVAEAHGGTLLATVSPLGGARFTLSLPLNSETTT